MCKISTYKFVCHKEGKYNKMSSSLGGRIMDDVYFLIYTFYRSCIYTLSRYYFHNPDS